MTEKQDFTGRTRLATVYLPIEMGAFVKIQQALLPLMDGDGPWDQQVDSNDESITFYAPVAS